MTHTTADNIPDLVDAVRDHSGLDEEQLCEVADHGADAGWPGFTYYSDTSAFMAAHGEPCGASSPTRRTISAPRRRRWRISGPFGGAHRSVQSATGLNNLLAWWALEAAARYVSDEVRS